MPDHRIEWNHSQCEHAEDFCNPEARFECLTPVPEPLSVCCRVGCEDCDTYSDCDASTELCTEDGHPDAPHCTQGHPLHSAECNALVFFEYDDSVTDYADGDYHDGPVKVVWEGEYYTWVYAEHTDA